MLTEGRIPEIRGVDVEIIGSLLTVSSEGPGVTMEPLTGNEGDDPPLGPVPSTPIAWIGESLHGLDPGRSLPPRDLRPATDASRTSSLRGSASAMLVILSYLAKRQDSRILCCGCS